MDVHSTTRLCVVFNENKNESRKGIDNIQISQKREMTEDEENKWWLWRMRNEQNEKKMNEDVGEKRTSQWHKF